MTQKYIPTDEEMRHCFEPSYSPNIDPLGQIDDPERGEIYDRWIAAHDAQTRAEALTLTTDEQKLVIDALYSESYRDKVCAANTITEYEERQAEFRRMHNELSLGLFSMVAEHRKGQQP